VRGLRTPRGFPGEASKAKDEWDIAILRERSGAASGFDIVLLVEVKASPSAATPDFARLLRGLQRLALASSVQDYEFTCDTGRVMLSGESLRALQPRDRALPDHVLYCGLATDEAPVVLSAASKAVLLAEPPSVAFGLERLLTEGAAEPARLLPVWEALQCETRLRSVLFQYDTSVRAREAMLHPDDLLQSIHSRAP